MLVLNKPNKVQTSKKKLLKVRLRTVNQKPRKKTTNRKPERKLNTFSMVFIKNIFEGDRSLYIANVPIKSRLEMFKASLDFLTRRITANLFNTVVQNCYGKLKRSDLNDIRRDILGGYALTRVKPFLFIPNKTDDTYLKWNIDYVDYMSIVNHYPEILSIGSTPIEDDIQLLSIKDVNQLLTDNWQGLDIYTKSFVHRKMRFLFMGTNNTMTVPDGLRNMTAELKIEGLRSILTQWPYVKSRLHLLNVGKRTVHNLGINKILYLTREGRNEVENTLQFISTDEADDYIDTCVESATSQKVYSPEDLYIKSELADSILEAAKNLRLSDSEARLIKILVTFDDEEFKEYLIDNRLIEKTEGIYDFIDKSKKVPIKTIGDFCGVCGIKRSKTILQLLRNYL